MTSRVFFPTLMASGHLRVLSLSPLGLFDSMCEDSECNVATLSVTCLIFLLSPIFYLCTFKSAKYL